MVFQCYALETGDDKDGFSWKEENAIEVLLLARSPFRGDEVNDLWQ